MSSKFGLLGKYKKRIFEILVIAVALAVLLPQLKKMLQNTDTLTQVSPFLILVASGIYFLTLFLAAASYIFLSDKPLSFLKTLLVQVVNGFTNRILPSGTGAIATSTSFLKKSGHTVTEAVSISVINNLLGFIAFNLVMFLLGAFSWSNLSTILPKLKPSQLIILSAAILATLFMILRTRKLKRRVAKSYQELVDAFRDILSNPLSGFMALLANTGITIVHVACLALCVISVGYSLPLAIIALVFMATISAISVSPTPNGLGVSELAMSLALQSFGLLPEDALAATLFYRIITFWLPIIPGFLAYKFARTKKII